MAISSKKWFFRVTGGILLTGSFLVLVNCLIDPYGLFRTDFSKQFQEPNQNFAKTKFILNHKDRYDSFLFGSSRVIYIDNTKIRNGTYYNYWYSEGVPKEHLDNIRLLVENNVGIRNILIGLDDFSYLVTPEAHLTNLLRQPHPLVTGKRPEVFYTEYFVRLTNLGSSVRKYFLHNVLKKGRMIENGIVFDVDQTGRMLCRVCDDLIEKDRERHVQDEKFSRPTHYEGNNLENTLDAIRGIVELAKEQNINLVFFINPIHKTTYLDTNLVQFFTFKRELAAITDFWDFSGLNSITTNNYYYHETSHYRDRVGDMMLERMFGYPRASAPPDFGILVTEKNIDVHLALLASQIKDGRQKRLVRVARQRGLPASGPREI
jgi:hypothetical protein